MTTLANRRWPAEWETHRACWLAWPSDESLWQEDLRPAQQEFTNFARAIARTGSGRPTEQLEVLVRTEEDLKLAETALTGLPYRLHTANYGDIWLRDTGPIFLEDRSVQFRFNGWGNKYILEGDDEVANFIAGQTPKFSTEAVPIIMEGGSLDTDGQGTFLTTRQCLLNPNRNPGLTQKEIEAALTRSLGAKKLLWIDEGLLNDHTDGHIDTIARFVAPGKVVVMAARDSNDPNARILDEIYRQVTSFTDASGKNLEVARIPSPGRVEDEDGEVMPASFVNFYIGNHSVVVPTYGTEFDEAAVEALRPLFPGRAVVGLAAKAILTGGGAFHCISQQEPLGESHGK